MSAPAISIGTLKYAHPNQQQEESPLWIERGGDETPHMYFADVSNALIHEIAYPFSDGVGGHLVNGLNLLPPVLIDTSKTTHELLVAIIVPQSPTDVSVHTFRFPSLGEAQGVAIPPAGFVDLVDEATGTPISPARRDQRILQFYNDTRQYVMLNIPQYISDPYGMTTPFEVLEETTGSWPEIIVGGTMWQKGCIDTQTCATKPELTHPNPFAVITSSGNVYTWQFNGAPSSTQEGFLTPFAQVMPGTTTVSLVDELYHGVYGLWALQPDGTEVVLIDGDNRNMQSTSLLPESQRIHAAIGTSTTTTPSVELYVSADDEIWYVQW